MGDMADCITVSDKRYDVATYDKYLQEPDRQYEYVMNLLEPIKHKIIGVHCGNHDEVLRFKLANALRNLSHSEDYILRESDWSNKVADSLNTKFLSDLAFTRLTFDDGNTHIAQFKIFSCHGAIPGGRVGNNINKLQDLSRYFDADIYLMGHTHNLVTDKTIYISIPQRGYKDIEQTKIYGSTGGFLKGYVVGNRSYVQSKILEPKRTGTITVSIVPRTRNLDVHS